MTTPTWDQPGGPLPSDEFLAASGAIMANIEQVIEGKSATIRITDPYGDWYEVGALGRHPRQRELWGLDLIALPSTGDWSIELTVDGPEGSGTGALTGIPVGERPGPPPAPMWLIAALPLIFLLWLGVRGWRQVCPSQSPEARAWAR